MTMDMSGERIGFLGGGYLASAIAAGLVKQKVVEPGNILVSDPRGRPRGGYGRSPLGLVAQAGVAREVAFAVRSQLVSRRVSRPCSRASTTDGHRRPRRHLSRVRSPARLATPIPTNPHVLLISSS